MPEQFAPTKFYKTRHFRRFFGSKFLLSALQVLGCYFATILHKKCVRKRIFTTIESSVNTLLFDPISTQYLTFSSNIGLLIIILLLSKSIITSAS